MTDSRRILIVDDEPGVLSAVSRCLLDTPHEVRTAASGHEALALLHEQPADLIVSDFRMPGMDGAAFLQQVMKLWPDTKRIILSAYTDSAILLAAVNEGRVHRFLTKPWQNETLLAAVDELLHETDVLNTVRQEVEELVKRNQVLAATNDQLQTLLNGLLQAVRTENAIPATPEHHQGTQQDATAVAILKTLSGRERQILERIASGQRPKEIAANLNISIKTVCTYKARLFDKMGFANEAALITFAVKHSRLLQQT